MVASKEEKLGPEVGKVHSCLKCVQMSTTMPGIADVKKELKREQHAIQCYLLLWTTTRCLVHPRGPRAPLREAMVYWKVL